MNTGIIRAMGGSGSGGDLRGPGVRLHHDVLAQVGSTIGLGLLFDTLVVRSLMTPCVAALLGKWFWWPQNIRSRPGSRPVPQLWPSLPAPQTVDAV